MILDHEEEVTAILRDIQHKKTLLVPVFCNSQHHVSTSNLTAIFREAALRRRQQRLFGFEIVRS